MAPEVKGGEFRYYYKNYDETVCNPVKVEDFNCEIEFNRNPDEKHNNVSIFNGETKYELAKYPGGEAALPIFSGDERFALEHIFNRDGNINDFSNEDFNYLISNNNNIIKLNKKYAYKVTASDEDIKAGKVTIQLRDILADGSTRSSGRTITIDIETQEEANAPKETPKSEGTSFFSRFLSW